MTLYDVQVLSESGRSGETIRVDAPDAEAAGIAALERVPAGWTVDRVSDATDHGEAWGVDTTAADFVEGPVAGVGEVPAESEPYTFPEVDEPTA